MARPSIAAVTRIKLFVLVLALSLAPDPGGATGLPDGAGRESVEATCLACHGRRQILRSAGYSRDGWRALIATMIDLSDDRELEAEIVAYLSEAFPPNDERAPRLIPGPVMIAFKEWTVPSLGQRSRDPVEAPDGGIWWAGQWGNLIGRIDPATGRMKEYALPANAKPHSVTIDRDGQVWYTGNKNGTMGKLDPASGEITVYPMPNPAARDPHTAVFDAAGNLWITLQHSNMIARLDPASGKVELVTLPTPGSRPYGIKIDAEGHPWVACNGSNCLVRVDPATLSLTEISLPHRATKVRRLDIAADGTIWYVNSARGRLGRLEPTTGEITEWQSPSGPSSHPYAIAVVDGIVWYNESGMRPDTLVRFDPATETFQSWPIPSGRVYAGIVRHMRPNRDGDLLIHQSSTNRIGLVTIGGSNAAQ